jgi:hypothetical protein
LLQLFQQADGASTIRQWKAHPYDIEILLEKKLQSVLSALYHCRGFRENSAGKLLGEFRDAQDFWS